MMLRYSQNNIAVLFGWDLYYGPVSVTVNKTGFTNSRLIKSSTKSKQESIANTAHP